MYGDACLRVHEDAQVRVGCTVDCIVINCCDPVYIFWLKGFLSLEHGGIVVQTLAARHSRTLLAAASATWQKSVVRRTELDKTKQRERAVRIPRKQESLQLGAALGICFPSVSVWRRFCQKAYRR